jgi:pimeloyl-ACP methyl ester carboxylesterase
MANARCGYLVVPENRSIATGPRIRMAVAIIPSVSQPPAADPIVHLAGGPGVDALAQAPTLVAAGLNHNRDLIIMDQRGNFHDEPALTCPEIDQFNALAVGLPYDSPSTEALHLAATQACHDRLVADGVDLSSYHTPENEADFADLRKVLKIKQWDVYGYSYGTDLALSLMRDYPKGIRSVILDSVVPPSVASLGWSWTNINEAFNNLFSACAAQSTCTSEYGNLSSLFTSLVQQLEANPVTTTAEPPQGGPPVAVVIDGGTLVNWLVGPQPILKISELPSAIYALSQNNPAPIATTRAVFTDPEGTGQFGYGLDYGVFCSEWVPYQPESEILVQGLLAFPTYPTSVLSQAPQLPYMTEDCAIWNVRAAPPSVRQVTISSIPTLLIDGSFDARTSPQWAVYAAGTLQNSTNIVIPGVVHFVLPKSPCAQSVVASFLSNPTAPDTSCVASLTPPIFN